MNADCLKAVTDSVYFVAPSTVVLVGLLGLVIGALLVSISAAVVLGGGRDGGKPQS